MAIIQDLLRREKFRFLAVGGWNTLVGYLLFVATHFLLSDKIETTGILVVSYFLAVPHSYLTQRWLVFRSKGKWRSQFVRFFVSNTVVFVLNVLLLPIFMGISGVSAPASQAIFVVLSTTCIYVLHKNFSFSERFKQGVQK